MRHNSGHPTNTHAAGRREFSRGSLLSLRLPKPRERRLALYRHQFAWRGAIWSNLHNRLYIPRGWVWGALVSGASGRGFGPALRGSGRGGFLCYCYVFAYGVDSGRLAIAAISFYFFIYAFCVKSYRGCGCFASAFLVWPSCVRWFCACV